MTFLVIGYGNPLRGDDGAGQVVAEGILEWQLQDVRVLALHQLAPEIAVDIAAASHVYFVDASLDPSLEHPRVTRLTPRSSATGVSHASSPAALLALAKRLYGATPNAHQIELPAETFVLHEGLSGKAQHGVRAALTYLYQIFMSDNF